MTSAGLTAAWPPRPGRRVLTASVLACLAAGALAVLWLWWQAPSTHAVRTPADVWVDLARATGMLAAYLMLVAVALMARVPLLERRLGTDSLAAAHRWIGTYLSGLVVVHVATVLTGYAEGAHATVLHEARWLVLSYPYVLPAAVALLLLAPVVGLSVRPVRRRLPYEAWHLLHLLAYVAIGLAVAHEVVDGLQFAGHRFASHLWVALHAVVLVLVLRFRVVEPLRLSLRHGFRVTAVTREPDGSVSVVVGGQNLELLAVQPGQYFRWRFLTGRAWWEAHPFSLSHEPTGSWLRMTAKPVGDHTRALDRLRPGVRVVLEGPYGAVTPALRRGARAVFVGAGSGMAPLVALAQAAGRGGGPVTLVYRVRDAGSVCFTRELSALAAAGAQVHIVAGGRGEPGVRRFLRLDLRRLLGDPGDVDLFLCGPERFVLDVTETAVQAGVPRRRIHTESYAW